MARYSFFLKPFWFMLALVVTVGAGLNGYAYAKVRLQSCFDTRWPYELSDLEHDRSLIRGVLDNGFRYVIKRNEQPENRVAVFLDVQAGSLQEKDDQRGVAHFLEHLMFNGTANFPPGSLVDFFQSIGMSFGGDTNAHTSFDETVYRLILPNGSEEDLAKGFLVMADYARGALLLDEEIARERGVILAEKRARDSAGYRIRVAETNVALRGTRYPERMVIGDEQVLKHADQKLLRSYYDAWYRPENMILVVVGDTDPRLAQELVDKYFAGLTGAGPEPDCPPFGSLAIQNVEPFYYHEPELGRTDVSVQTFWDVHPENDSRELQRRELLQFLGTKIMGYRLEKLLDSTDLPFSNARYYAGNIINRIGYGSLSAQTDGDNWQESLALLVKTLQRALEYGFLRQEVDRAKAEILAELDEKILTEKTIDSRRIGRNIIRHLNSNRVYQTPEQEKALYGSIIDEVSPEDVNGQFGEVWHHGNRLISVTGDAKMEGDPGAIIDSLYRKALSSQVLPPDDHKNAVFPYLQPPPYAGPLPEASLVKDIDVERLVFPHGLRVNLKETAFTENTFLFSATFGKGALDEKAPGMAMLAEHVINGSGSGRYRQSEIDALVAGSSVEMSFKAADAYFSWSGAGLIKDFDLFCQLLYMKLFDVGFRETVFARVKENYALQYQKISREIEGAVPLYIQPFLASYNYHFGLPPWRDLEAVTFEDLAAWAKSSIQPTDLEISLVGDFKREAVIPVLAKYFGGGSFARPLPSGSVPRILFPAGKKLDVTVSTSLEKSLISIAWPTEDFWNIHRTRRLQILAEVFSDRLRTRIREKLGASYSPSVISYASRVYDDYGFIKTQMVVEPGLEDMIIGEILKIGNQLQQNGITEDELIRAREPILTSLGESLKTNRYWLYSVLALSARYPVQLQWPETLIDDYKSISVAEIKDLAGKYLLNDRAAVARVSPGETGLGLDGPQPRKTDALRVVDNAAAEAGSGTGHDG